MRLAGGKSRRLVVFGQEGQSVFLERVKSGGLAASGGRRSICRPTAEGSPANLIGGGASLWASVEGRDRGAGTEEPALALVVRADG